MAQSKRVLVTGANGFVGRSLISSLHDNYLITATYRNPNELPKINDSLDLQYVYYDLENVNTDYDDLLNNIDTVIHLAGRVHFDDSNSKDAEDIYYKDNVLGTKLLAEAASKLNVRRFIYLSTVKVIGENNSVDTINKPIVFNEDDIPHPQGAYAKSKLDAEIAIRKICRESTMDFVILRPTLIYGPGVKANFLSLLDAINKNYTLPLASVKNKRSLLYIGNLIHAIFTCIGRAEAANKTYLISDVDISVPELIKKIAHHMEKNTTLFHCPVTLLKFLAGMVGRESVINRITDSLLVDSSRFRRELNWTPPCSLDEGIRETVSWYCNRE